MPKEIKPGVMALPLNDLYEVVPCSETAKATPGTVYYVITNYHQKETAMFTKGIFNVLRSTYEDEIAVSYLRPLPPERMEEWVREIVGKAWAAAVEWENDDTGVTAPDLQTFTDNLIRELTGNNSLTTKQ